MRSARSVILVAAVAAAIPHGRLLAQARDTTVFHRRQWGVDFDIGNGFVGAGLIHFRDATHAMVLDLSANVSTATGGGASGNASQVNLSLGARRYHPFASRLFFSRTLGLEGSYGHRFVSPAATTNTWTAGLFGELGGGWLVTPHLAVGAAWRLSADYAHSQLRGGGVTTTAHGFSFTLGNVYLKGQIYF